MSSQKKIVEISTRDNASQLLNIQNEQNDQSIVEVLGTASHIAVYKFERKEGQGSWIRIDVEGAAFVVRSTQIPYFRVIVLNRLGAENFVVNVANVDKIKLQKPYLMLRLTDLNVETILGLWFHDDVEREKILDVISMAMKESALHLQKINDMPPSMETTPPIARIPKKVDEKKNSSYSDLENISKLTQDFHLAKSGGVVDAKSDTGDSVKAPQQFDLKKINIIRVADSQGKGQGKGKLQTTEDLLTDQDITLKKAKSTTRSSAGTSAGASASVGTSAGASASGSRLGRNSDNESSNDNGTEEEEQGEPLVLFAPSDLLGYRREIV